MQNFLKLIFLDIEGVMKSPGDFSWNNPAIQNLKNLCEVTGAKIIVSSSLRLDKTLDQLKTIFKTHGQGLDNFILDRTPEINLYRRDQEIQAYLNTWPENHQPHIFVILDDSFYEIFSKKYPQNFVYCKQLFGDQEYQKALNILNF